MRPSLLSIDYINRYKFSSLPELGAIVESILKSLLETDITEESAKDFYYRPDTIIKSSVGGFYDTSMLKFLETIKLVDKELSKTVPNLNDRLHSLSSLLPMGLISPDTVFIDKRKPYYSSMMLDCLTAPVPEIKDYFIQMIPDVPEINKDSVSHIEKIAFKICAGYTPQDTSDVVRVLSDPNYVSENIIANILYPWAMQPLSQLRLIIPSIDRSGLCDVYNNYLNITKDPSIGPALDVGYQYTFEILSDLFTSQYFTHGVNNHPLYSQSQLRTPLTLFDLPSDVTDISDKAKKSIDECVQRSKHLYIEIIKTGLRYQACYATLGGFRSRFYVSGNLGAILELLSVSELRSKTNKKVDRIVGEIRKHINNSTWITTPQ